MAKIIILGALPQSLSNFRGELIRSLVAAGHEVTAMAAPADVNHIKRIEAFGARFRSYPIRRSGLNPFHDVSTLVTLRKAFDHVRADVVLAYTIKPIIWSGFALFGHKNTQFFALVTGLGFAFEGKGAFRRMLTFLASTLYRLSLKRAAGVIFQNPDDLQTFVSRGIVPPHKCRIVGGSGVDLTHFAGTPLPEGSPTFLLISRLLREKGLREYADAARAVRTQYPDAIFQIAGPADPSPDAIPIAEIRAWQKEGVIRYLGEVSDVRPLIAGCHVYVLPSYHEGMPRTVLEAMAMGRPILTTDVPGCRETVVPGENGHLVPKGDADALAERLVWFIEHRAQWEQMGQVSLKIAEERFDVKKVNADLSRYLFSTPTPVRFM